MARPTSETAELKSLIDKLGRRALISLLENGGETEPVKREQRAPRPKRKITAATRAKMKAAWKRRKAEAKKKEAEKGE